MLNAILIGRRLLMHALRSLGEGENIMIYYDNSLRPPRFLSDPAVICADRVEKKRAASSKKPAAKNTIAN